MSTAATSPTLTTSSTSIRDVRIRQGYVYDNKPSQTVTSAILDYWNNNGNFTSMMNLLTHAEPIQIFGDQIHKVPTSLSGKRSCQYGGYEYYERDYGVLYYRNGENEADPWYMLLELTDGRYAYLIASTDYYTGFEIGGELKLYISDKLSTIINGAMGEFEYNQYINDTWPSFEYQVTRHAKYD